MQNKPARINNNYILEDEIGRGGTAVVYRARHAALKPQFAVKLLLNQEDESVNRFKREAELTSSLRHPNIIQIFDHGTQGPYFYTVMEYVPGGSLRQRLKQIQDHTENPLQIEDILWIVRQIGEALDHAHSRGIVHRDVTPGNILLDWKERRALLTDFGIARLPDAEGRKGITATRVILGTPGFYSPEHLRSATSVTTQSDLFSLGVVMYVMLTGRMPWQKLPTNPDEEFERPDPIRTYRDIHPGVDRVVQTLLAYNPENRYANARAAIEALARIFPNMEPVRDLSGVSTGASLYITEDFESSDIVDNEVEEQLGPDLVQQVIERTHRRAHELAQPENLVRVFDHWSSLNRWRIRNLGRMATFSSVKSRNIYFFTLEALYEQRDEPQVVEVPDHEKREIKQEAEVAPERVKLPEPSEFKEESGMADITGSYQVLNCFTCNGRQSTVCTTCGGKARIKDSVPGEGGQGTRTIEVACPTCKGRGHIPCLHCDATGRMLRYKTMAWRRWPGALYAHTDLPDVDEAALKKQAREVYDLRSPTIRPEWRRVPMVLGLIQELQEQTDPHVKVVMLRLHITVVPVTEVQFELGHQPRKPQLTAADQGEQDQPIARPTQRRRFRIHLLGFDQEISQAEAQLFRDGERLFVWGTMAFLTLLVIIMLFFVLVVY